MLHYLLKYTPKTHAQNKQKLVLVDKIMDKGQKYRHTDTKKRVKGDLH